MYWWASPSKLIFLLLRCILLKTKQYQHIRLTTFHKKLGLAVLANAVFVTFDNNQERLRKIKDYITCLETNVFRIGGINHQIKKRRKKFASFFFWCGLNILVRWCASKLWFIDQGHDIIKLLLYVLVLEIMIIGYGTPRVINQNWLNF